MTSNIKENLRMVLDCLNEKISVDEACNKYNINRYTFYKKRRLLINVALDFLARHLENVDEYYNLYNENKSLQRKIEKLQKEKLYWESKYNLIYHYLDAEMRRQNINGCE